MHRAIPVIIIVLSLRCSSFARAEAPVNAPRCEFGVEGPMPREGRNPGELPIFLNAVADLGAQFIVASFTPEWHTELARRRGNYIGSEGTVAAYREFADLCRQRSQAHPAVTSPPCDQDRSPKTKDRSPLLRVI